MVVAGLVPVICRVISPRCGALAIVGLLVAIAGAQLFRKQPRQIWHLRLSNSSGQSTLLAWGETEEEMTSLAQEINEALFKGHEKRR